MSGDPEHSLVLARLGVGRGSHMTFDFVVVMADFDPGGRTDLRG